MKKIYMILAAITLLSMSLNAQTRAVETMTSTLNFTAACGGSGTADDGAAWTVTSNGTESNFDSSRGIHYGTNSASVQYIELTTSDIHGTIKSVVVEASRASQTNGYVNVFVDGNQFGSGAQTLTSSNAAYTFTGEATGTILVRIYKNSNATRALYCKSITVTYEVDDPNTANLDLFSNTTDENMCLPVYGGYHDHTQHNQMVYPASLLTDMVGKKIKSMTFYPASVTDNDGTFSGINFYNGSVTFKMMEVTGSTGFNSSNPSFITGSMTTVKTVTMPSSANTSATTWKITFDQEYEYNGGDLVIDVTNTTGDYKRTYFYTGTTSIAYPGYYTYSGSTGSASVAVDYVPKVTFTYENSTNPELAISPETQTIDDNAAGSLTVTGTDITGNISVSAADNTNWSLNPTSLSSNGGSVNVSYTGRELTATTTVTASATGATDATATVNYVADVYIVGNFGNGWDFNNGTQMTYNNGTYTTTITVDAGNYILFARMLGNGVDWNTRYVFGPNSSGDWWMDADQKNGTIDLYDDDPIYFPNGGTYTITINSDGTFTITKLSGEQTAPPTISYTVEGEYVTITARGDGTVTLNVPGYDPVIGENGEASITIPCGVVSNTITVTATAQEDGKTESTPASAQVTIPAGSGWTEMDGTYDNPNDLLSFLKDGEDIMMVDQFLASTLNNAQPDHYTYTLRQTVNGETNTSTPVNIPVYKTNSTMQGLYTLGQIKSDKDMHLKANVLNTEMDYDVNPDHNVLYYSLYRSGLNETYPVIDVPHRISQLQKFEDNTSGTVQYFMYENHTSGVSPRYDHLGNEIAERLDTNWVAGAYNDQLAYVPVIWTFGLYSGREDGKNNSYGSDIKRETLGEVTAEAKIYQTTSAWGKFKDSNNVEYCIYYPEIKITGVCPVTMTAGDGDVYTYEPYMFRAWCTYEGARDFTSVDNALVDNGPKTTPFMLDSVIVVDPSQNIVTIGRDWLPSDTYKLPWAFGVPVTEDPQNVTFIVRFYYRQVVEEGGQQEGGSKLRLGNDAEEFFIAQGAPSAQSVVTAVNELFGGSEVVSVTYYNAQGMQSSKPFKGMNIIVTRYSDGSTSTMKVMK